MFPGDSNLDLAVSASGDPEAKGDAFESDDASDSPESMSSISGSSTLRLAVPAEDARMYLSHVVTHHVDCSQQVPPVAETQQQVKDHLLLKKK
uniref:Uncharacterized protein n=1 Tax=Peronospora matthiolae TaxID=2874970 RepID=A0AAV1V701_9STRA